MYLNEALRHSRSILSGMEIPIYEATTLFTLLFLDDQIVITQYREHLKFITIRLFKAFEDWLSVN